MKRDHRIAVFSLYLAFAFALALPARGAVEASASGIIEGRVSNSANGDYLERARIVVEGTTIETFSDSAGFYRLTNVPAGTARVKAFYTGLNASAREVTVGAGRTAQHDIALTGDESVVKLSEFLVTTTREM